MYDLDLFSRLISDITEKLRTKLQNGRTDFWRVFMILL